MRLLLVAFFLFSNVAFAQKNLLPNGSFENVNICEKNCPCGPSGWNMYNRVNEIKYRDDACTNPHSGENYLVFYILNAGNRKDKMFLEAPLICNLEKDKEYTLDFYLKVRTEKYIPLSVFFCKSSQMRHSVNFEDSIPTFSLTEKDIAEPVEFPTKKWVHFKKIFIAKGNEKYFVLGNFKKYPDSKNNLLFGRNDFDESKVYYNIDDISLVCNHCDSACSDYSESLKTIYLQNERHSKIDTTSFSVNVFPIENEFKNDTLILPEGLFKFDSSVLNAAYNKVLDSFIMSLKERHFEKVKILGFTDNKGSEGYNTKLSLMRAREVANYFVSKQFIHESNIEAVGLGASNPIVSNSTEEGRRKNRRIEIILLKN